jgi:hypothetical protein
MIRNAKIIHYPKFCFFLLSYLHLFCFNSIMNTLHAPALIQKFNSLAEISMASSKTTLFLLRETFALLQAAVLSSAKWEFHSWDSIILCLNYYLPFFLPLCSSFGYNSL